MRKKKKKLLTLSRFVEEMKKLVLKAPRFGVKPTKVIRDKTKYTRRSKHRKTLEE